MSSNFNPSLEKILKKNNINFDNSARNLIYLTIKGITEKITEETRINITQRRNIKGITSDDIKHVVDRLIPNAGKIINAGKNAETLYLSNLETQVSNREERANLLLSLSLIENYIRDFKYSGISIIGEGAPAVPFLAGIIDYLINIIIKLGEKQKKQSNAEKLTDQHIFDGLMDNEKMRTILSKCDIIYLSWGKKYYFPEYCKNMDNLTINEKMSDIVAIDNSNFENTKKINYIIPQCKFYSHFIQNWESNNNLFFVKNAYEFLHSIVEFNVINLLHKAYNITILNNRCLLQLNDIYTVLIAYYDYEPRLNKNNILNTDITESSTDNIAVGTNSNDGSEDELNNESINCRTTSEKEETKKNEEDKKQPNLFTLGNLKKFLESAGVYYISKSLLKIDDKPLIEFLIDIVLQNYLQQIKYKENAWKSHNKYEKISIRTIWVVTKFNYISKSTLTMRFNDTKKSEKKSDESAETTEIANNETTETANNETTETANNETTDIDSEDSGR